MIRLARRRERPSKDADEQEAPSSTASSRGRKDVDDEHLERARAHRWTHGSTLSSKAASALLLAALACGPVSLVLPRGGGQAATEPAPAVAVEDRADSAVAGAAGLELVQAWLEATRDDHVWLDSIMGSASSRSLGASAVAYDDPQIVSVEQVGTGGVFSVTVSARVDTVDSGSEGAADADGGSVPVRMAWVVPIRVDDGDAVVLGWPSPTTVATTTSSLTSYGETVGVSTPVGQAVGDLLAAYVTGGDVTRLISPESAITALPGGVYSAASVTELSADAWEAGWEEAPPEGQTIQVLAQSTLTSVSGSQLPSTWSLTLTVRDGRWEVAAINQAPAQASAPEPSVEESSSTNPTSEEGESK